MLQKIRRVLARAPQPPIDIHVSSLEQEVPALVHYAEPRAARLHLPAGCLTMQGAFAYSGGWHPFVAALEHGPEALTEFYRSFQPANLNEMYMLDMPDQLGADLPSWELPWLYRLERTPPPGEAGLGAEHGHAFYGPATSRKVEVEYDRLRRVTDSIARKGYRPDDYTDDIQGHFIRVGCRYRFFVRRGKHRTAALVHLGWKSIPVRMRDWWPRLIDAQGVLDWPLVRDGKIAPEFAQAVLARYVENDGTQQRARWRNC